MVDFNIIIYIVSIIIFSVFYGIYVDDIWQRDEKKRKDAVDKLTKYGFIPLTLLNGIRWLIHKKGIMYNNALIAEANFAVGFAALINVLTNTSLNSYSMIYLTFGIYLFLAVLKSIWVNNDKLFGSNLNIHLWGILLMYISGTFIMISTGVLCISKDDYGKCR